jgi:hypothetical protein
VDEREQAMGFHINTIVVINLSKGACNQILGQVMDLNYFPWIFNLCLTKHRHFLPIIPYPSNFKVHVFIIAPTFETLMLVQGGDPQQLWHQSRFHEGFLGVGKGVGDVGVLGHFGTLPFYV